MSNTVAATASRVENIARLTLVYMQGRRAFNQARSFASSGYVVGSVTDNAWRAGWLDSEQSQITGRACHIRRP